MYLVARLMNNYMFDFIQSLIIKIISILPDGDPNDPVITAVNSAFATLSPQFAKLDLVFPINTLFKILLLVLFVEMTIFLFTFILKGVDFFKP